MKAIQHTSLEDVSRYLEEILDIDSFTPQTTGLSNVTNGYGRWQRLGQLVYVHYWFLGTNMSMGTDPATAFILLPISPYIKKNQATGLLFPSSMFKFSSTEGAHLTHGHQVTNTNKIVPDTSISASNGFVVQGIYWTDNY